MRPCDAAYKQDVLLECYAALESAGFTRYRKEAVDWPLDGGFHGWVGLNTALEADHVEISPFVGVHVVPLERLWTSLKVGKYPGKYDRGYATYAVHMGELDAGRDEEGFIFAPEKGDAFVALEARRLGRLYATVGLDYAKSVASYEALLPLLEGRVGMLGGYPERVASCLYLMGRLVDARTFAEQFLKVRREYFEGFAMPFLEMLARESAR